MYAENTLNDASAVSGRGVLMSDLFDDCQNSELYQIL